MLSLWSFLTTPVRIAPLQIAPRFQQTLCRLHTVAVRRTMQRSEAPHRSLFQVCGSSHEAVQQLAQRMQFICGFQKSLEVRYTWKTKNRLVTLVFESKIGGLRVVHHILDHRWWSHPQLIPTDTAFRVPLPVGGKIYQLTCQTESWLSFAAPTRMWQASTSPL